MNFSRRIFNSCIFIFLFASCGSDSSLNQFQIVEDFSDYNRIDFTFTTGLWNTLARRAMAGMTPNGEYLRLVTFGDGSDGELDTSANYTFDTGTHPNGFNFKNLRILDGIVTVKGSYPLVIRSLGEVTILPTLNVGGWDGSAGVSTTASNTAGPAGPQSRAGKTDGGKGGDATASGGTALDGGNGLTYTGDQDTTTQGTGSNAAGTPANSASLGAGRPLADFDYPGKFISGTGGGGGGGHYDGAEATHATGGSGGGGGGTLRIIAVGKITLRTVLAKGGTGGNAASTTGSCSGAGGGGNGGAVWLQSLTGFDAPTQPTLTGGTGGLIVGACGSVGSNGLNGAFRVDGPDGTRPMWAGGTNQLNSAKAAIGKAFYVQAKPYRLDTLNAVFSTPEIDSNSQQGQALVEYSGSSDGYTYTDFTPQLISLNGKNIRYLKIRISIVPATFSSPYVSRIRIPYQESGSKGAKFKLGIGF